MSYKKDSIAIEKILTEGGKSDNSHYRGFGTPMPTSGQYQYDNKSNKPELKELISKLDSYLHDHSEVGKQIEELLRTQRQLYWKIGDIENQIQKVQTTS